MSHNDESGDSTPLPPSGSATSALNGITPSSKEMSSIVFYSLLCGATSLIPIPFLDDWIFSLLRRFMAKDLLAVSGYSLSLTEANSLMKGRPVWQGKGCLYQTGYFLVVGPLIVALYVAKKLFKKILYILSIKEATDRAVLTFHQGYLAHRSGRFAARVSLRFESDTLSLLRETIHETVENSDTSAVSHLFKAVVKVNRETLSRAGKLLVKGGFRGGAVSSGANERILRSEKSLLGQLTEDASTRLLAEKEYLDALGSRFDHLARIRGLFPSSAGYPNS